MKIVVLGSKYGKRVPPTINERSEHEATFLEIKEPPSNVVLEEDHARSLLPGDLSGFDLVISYILHPDLQIALAETAEPPVLYEVVPEPAVKDEITSLKEDVAFPPYTPCSLEPDTGVPNIDRFAERFGRPELRVDVSEGRIENIEVLRGSPCGATWEAAEEVEGEPATRETVNTFALRACHRCAAPRFGRLETKDLASYFHAEALARALGLELDVEPEEFHAPV
ncbi:MAG: hypothetical protein GXO28_05745 [Methanopyri archaeon]|nr:hypothetical protein [Methanopyri archaeon]